MVNRPVVGAHYGLKDWLVQRVTAIYMALFTLFFVICLLCLPEFGTQEWQEAWKDLFASWCVCFFGFLFVLSLCYHAWIGVRDIWMDYVKPAGVRLALHIVTLLLLVGYAGWAVHILWRPLA
ncbi:MAG: succinate dehydrogenase, hydrophobic membrane anchor protein [Azoarcus sp.]|jgi:succinate dehydrogenase / fumarate reductase membrane anchor subunit|nr:succinate dehydrogenase, hydrophobic membrane anchor protein [Azoarcus sp.]